MRQDCDSPAGADAPEDASGCRDPGDHPEDRDGERHVAGVLPLPTRWSTRCPRRVSGSSSIRTAAASEACRALMPSRWARAPWWTLRVWAI